MTQKAARSFVARTSYALSIGGLNFVAKVPEDIAVVEEDSLYVPFLSAESPARSADAVQVTLKLHGAPDVDRLPLVFDTGETWTAHRDGGDTLLRLRTPSGPDSHLWTARLPDERRLPVEVWCGKLLADIDRGRLANPLHYPLDQLLTMWTLADRGGLVIHAGGVALGDRGIFLAGRSGTGKTTFLRLLEGRATADGRKLDSRVFTGLSDDRVVARRASGGEWDVYGTPWAGEGRVAEARRVPLAAAVFLHQAARNELRPLTPSAALAQLLPVASIPFFDAGRRDAALAVAGELVATVPAFELHFRPEPAALELLTVLQPG